MRILPKSLIMSASSSFTTLSTDARKGDVIRSRFSQPWTRRRSSTSPSTHRLFRCSSLSTCRRQPAATVNAVLDRCSPRGLSHCEEIAYTDAFLDRAFDCDWLSGHIYRDAFAGRLTWLNRPVEYFASTREPIAQLLSSINWHFEISHRGTSLAHPVAAQRDIAEVQATDFSQVSAIMALLLKFDSGLLNCQARCILGSDFRLHLGQRNNPPFEFLLLHRHRANTGRPLPSLRNRRDPARCQRAPRERSLKIPLRHHALSNARTSRISRLSPLPRYRPLRFAFGKRRGPRKGAVHSAGDSYRHAGELWRTSLLDANPDVASAVCANEFRSGREHFDASGHAEGRRKLVPAPVPPVLFAIAGDAVRYNDCDAGKSGLSLRRLQPGRWSRNAIPQAITARLVMTMRRPRFRSAGPIHTELTDCGLRLEARSWQSAVTRQRSAGKLRPSLP